MKRMNIDGVLTGALLILGLSFVFSGGVLWADCGGTVTVTHSGDGGYFTLTNPEGIHINDPYPVNITIDPDNTAFIAWYLYENGTLIASDPFALHSVDYTITRTQTTGGPFEYHLYSRIMEAHHFYDWVNLYNTTAGDNNTGLSSCGPCDDLCSIVDVQSFVDAGSGNLVLDYNLTNILPINNLPHNFTVYYNSQDVVTDTVLAPLGNNWTHTFNHSITETTTSSLVYVDGTGNRIFYNDDDSDDVFEPLDRYGSYSVITKNASTFTLELKDQTIMTFTNSGYLSDITDINGHDVALSYTGNTLTKITLPNSQCMTLTYSGDLLSSIEDPGGNVTTFTYTSDLLTKIEKADSWDWEFTYITGTNRVSTVTDPLDDETTYAYTDEKLTSVTKSVNGSSKSQTMSYDTSTDTFTLTDFDSTSSTTKYNYRLRTWEERTDGEGNVITNTFDANRNLLDQNDAEGNTTEYEYDSRGNVLTRTDAADNKIQYLYEDPDNPDLPTRIIDDLNITTYMEYDDNGNMTKLVKALGTSVEQETIITYYTTGVTKGKVYETEVDPGGLSIITRQTYDSNGYPDTKTIDYGVGTLNIEYKTEYNSLGQLTKEYNPRSSSIYTTYTYDSRGNLTQITDPYSVVTKMEYDKMDRLTDIYRDYGGTDQTHTEHTYNNMGWLTKTIVGKGDTNITTEHTYYDNGILKKTTGPVSGDQIEYEYYDNGWLKKTTRKLNATENAITQYEYDDNGNQTKITDPENGTITSTYDSLNRVLTVTDQELNVTTYHYPECGCGSADWIQDARGNKTYTYLDDLRRVKYVRTPTDNITIAYEYDNDNRTIKVIGPWKDADQDGIADDADTADIQMTDFDNAGRVISTSVNSHTATQYEYDDAGNQTKITDSVGDVTEFDYDNMDRLTVTTVDPSGTDEYKIKNVYDNLGRVKELIQAYGDALETSTYFEYNDASQMTKEYLETTTYQTLYQYNDRSQMTQMTDANSKVTTWDFDAGGRVIKKTNALNDYIEYEYNKKNNRTKITNLRSSSTVDTTYTYYKNDLLKTTTYKGYSGNNVTTNYYDGNGNLTKVNDGKNQDIEFTLDNNNRVITKTYPDNSTVGYTYDAEGNLLTIDDANTDITNEYDDLNRVIAITDANYSPSKVILYTYNEDNTRKSMKLTDANNNLVMTVEYIYDSAKRLSTVKRDGTLEATYTYNDLSQRTKSTRNQPGSYTDYGYHATTRWLTSVTNKKQDATVISSFTYINDDVGNRTKLTLNGGDYIDYTYDDIYQLTEEDRTGSTSYTLTWTYDEIGNRLTQVLDSTTTTNYAYNDANQLISDTVNSTTNLYDYDANGNLITKTQGANTWTWDYDYNNMVISYYDPTTTNNATYAYDATLRRITKTVNSVTEKYVLDGVDVIADYDGSNVLQAEYVTPMLDQNLIVSRSGNTYYYFQDGLGSVRNILNSSEVSQNTYDYYAFGESLSWTQNVTNRYTYTGREWDAESQNYHSRIRQYNPSTGKFNRRDLIGYVGGFNLYAYVVNNPVNFIDSYGLVRDKYETYIKDYARCELMGGVWKKDECCCDKEIFDPKEKCCEKKTVVDQVKISVINRNGGERTPVGAVGAARNRNRTGHIDLIIPGVGLVGFYGDTSAADAKGASVGWNLPGFLLKGKEWSGSSYLQPESATGVKSTICEMSICPSDAKKMADKAKEIHKNPGRFKIWGRNCSTMATEILRAGNVMKRGIGGTDTPQALMDQMSNRYNMECFNGYTTSDTEDGSDVKVKKTGPAPAKR